MKTNPVGKSSKKKDSTVSKYSAILVVETKKERMRTIKEYEKERAVLRNQISR